MLTSDQNRKINEIVEEFKEAADFTVWSIPKTYGDVSGFWMYAAFEV